MDKASTHPAYIITYTVVLVVQDWLSGALTTQMLITNTWADGETEHVLTTVEVRGWKIHPPENSEPFVGLFFFGNLSRIWKTVQLLPGTWLCSSPSWRKMCRSQPQTQAHTKVVWMQRVILSCKLRCFTEQDWGCCPSTKLYTSWITAPWCWSLRALFRQRRVTCTPLLLLLIDRTKAALGHLKLQSKLFWPPGIQNSPVLVSNWTKQAVSPSSPC